MKTASCHLWNMHNSFLFLQTLKQLALVMLNSTNNTALTKPIDKTNKVLWVSPSYEKIEIRLGKTGGEYDAITSDNNLNS